MFSYHLSALSMLNWVDELMDEEDDIGEKENP